MLKLDSSKALSFGNSEKDDFGIKHHLHTIQLNFWAIAKVWIQNLIPISQMAKQADRTVLPGFSQIYVDKFPVGNLSVDALEIMFITDLVTESL